MLYRRGELNGKAFSSASMVIDMSSACLPWGVFSQERRRRRFLWLNMLPKEYVFRSRDLSKEYLLAAPKLVLRKQSIPPRFLTHSLRCSISPGWLQSAGCSFGKASAVAE